MLRCKSGGIVLSLFVAVFSIHAQVQDTVAKIPVQESNQQTNLPAPTYQQPPQTGSSAELMPVTFSEAYIQSEQSLNLYKAGSDIKSSIIWSLVGGALSLTSSLVLAKNNGEGNEFLVLGLGMGSLTCGIIAIVKNWQAGTKLQKASGRRRY